MRLPSQAWRGSRDAAGRGARSARADGRRGVRAPSRPRRPRALVAQVDEGDDRESLRAAEVVVDFTAPAVVMDNLQCCLQAGLSRRGRHHRLRRANGSTQVREWLRQAPASGVLIAPNFGIGAVLMMRVRRARGPLLRVGRDRRAAPPRQGRRPERHRRDAPPSWSPRPRRRPGSTRPVLTRRPSRLDGARGAAPRRRAGARDPAGRARRPPGSAARHRRRDADHAPRLAGPRARSCRACCWRCAPYASGRV